MNKDKHDYQAKTLEKAFNKAKSLDYNNGMATYPVFVQRQHETVKVIRKCGDLERPEIFLIIAESNKNAGYVMPNLEKLQKDVKECVGLYGNINIKFKQRHNAPNNVYDCVINTF